MIWNLFWIFFKIGLFSFGGGYAMMPMIQEAMLQNGYMTIAEITDMLAISQMTPGPVAVNIATFVGMRTAGVWGAVLATAGVILPSMIIALVVARFFYGFQKKPVVQGILYGVRPVVTGLIAATALTMCLSVFMPGGAPSFDVDYISLGIAVIIALLMFKVKLSPVAVICIGGVLSLALYIILGV